VKGSALNMELVGLRSCVSICLTVGRACRCVLSPWLILNPSDRRALEGLRVWLSRVFDNSNSWKDVISLGSTDLVASLGKE
jgi:hypothetical protein